MTLELIEDAQARSWRITKARHDAFACIRVCATYGIPLCIISAFALWSFAAGSIKLYTNIAVVPVALAVTFYFAPYVHRLFRNRWRLTDTRLVLRGEKAGSIRWERVTSWSTNDLPELPGYYLLRLAAEFHGPADLVLSKVAFAPDVVEDVFVRHIKAERGVPPNGGPATRLGRSGVTDGPPSGS